MSKEGVSRMVAPGRGANCWCERKRKEVGGSVGGRREEGGWGEWWRDPGEPRDGKT